MPVYVVVDIAVHDPEVFSQYLSRVIGLVKKNNGHYLVRGGKVTSILGGWNPGRLVIIEFPSREDMERCFGSEEYRKITPLRDLSSTGSIIMVEGVNDES